MLSKESPVKKGPSTKMHSTNVCFRRYEWKKDGVVLSYVNEVRLSPSSGNLTFTDLGSEHEGYYQCFAHNAYGISISNVTQLVRPSEYDRSNRPISQIPKCTCSISHNAPFRTEICTFLFRIEHCGIWNRCILGFVNSVNYRDYSIMTTTIYQVIPKSIIVRLITFCLFYSVFSCGKQPYNQLCLSVCPDSFVSAPWLHTYATDSLYIWHKYSPRVVSNTIS